jgi:hypothetical protein
MGLLDDIDAAERTEREPVRSRFLRRIGGAIAIGGVVMCLIGLLGGRWWQLEFDTGPISIGLDDIRYCDTSGEHCDGLPEHEFIGYARTRYDDEPAIRNWLFMRKYARYGLIAGIVASAVLAAIAVRPRRHDATRLVAAMAGVVAVVGFVLVWAFATRTPFDLLTRGLHSYVAIFGLIDLLVGAALAGIPSPHVAIPTAKVVQRG